MDNSKWKNIVDTANVFLHGWSVSNKNFVLDPLTCLIRLAMISNLPGGTKISIQQNRVTYNHASFFQGPVRWVSGDTRDDLHNLHNPLQKIASWYFIDNEPFQFLLDKAIKGLQIVKNSYPSQSIITHTLDHYSNILEKSIKSKYEKHLDLDSIMMRDQPLEIDKEKKEKKNSNSKNDKDTDGSNMTDTDKNSEDEKNIRENLLYQSFKKLWNYRQILTIYYLFKEIDKLTVEDLDQKNSYIQSTEVLLDMKETIVTQFITRVTTVL